MLSKLIYLSPLTAHFTKTQIFSTNTFIIFPHRENSIECVLFDKCAADTAAAYQEATDTIIVAVLNLCRVCRNLKGN